MDAADLKFGIPNIELRCPVGTKINPSSFAGHELIVLFTALDPEAARHELASYRHHCTAFVDRDAWLIAFVRTCSDETGDGTDRILTVPDPDDHAWVAFRNLTERREEMDRTGGATFLFTRGGGLHRYWHGSGHADDVLAELQTPPFERTRS